MNRVLLVGDDGSRSSAGAGAGACIARTKRFSTALESSGLPFTICSPSEGSEGRKEILELLSNESFSSIVAISPFPAEAAALADPGIPLWIDLNGMHPAEIQLLKGHDGRDGERILRMLSLENSLLLKGDIFSTPSARQSFAVLGELLLLGRELSFSDGLAPVVPLPHCANGFSGVGGISAKPFKVISTGSFNRWFDHSTLFDCIEKAMNRNAELVFEVTGGRTPFCKEKYDEFLEMVEGSSHRDRYLLHGWVPESELQEVYRSASAAVYTDIRCPETLLGARTRALDWISRGIPVVCTEGAEISEEIQKNNLGIVVPGGDSSALANAIIDLTDRPQLVESIRISQEEWCSHAGSSHFVFQPLIRWCRHPIRLAGKAAGSPTVPSLNSFQYLRRLFRELSSSKSPEYAVKRLLSRMQRSFG
ncbi:MAG TPA: glycosyltransferase [Candidatus Sabulitectum sp.]|nr:glycosyltransferase [Candidatus Sabulitectum sp.]HRW77094.1 glycosyltransferase [Candidatus Sabulitectum sp.]